jgi:putative transposase
MSLIKRSYKYRMYPNKTQEELLAKTFGCVRVIWNACVDSFNSYDKETNPNPKFPTKSDLVIEKPWLNEVSAATLQQKQRDFIEFSRQYFNKNRKEKLGKPNYKNKTGRSQKEREAVGGRGMLGRMGASPFPWIQRHDLRINHIFVCTKCIII